MDSKDGNDPTGRGMGEWSDPGFNSFQRASRMFRLCVLMISLVPFSISVRAESVIITYGSSNIDPGGASYIDVFISSASPQQLTATTFTFQIGGSPTLEGALEFTGADFAPPNYVFGGATGNSYSNLDDDITLTGGDYYQSGMTSVAINSTPKTLVRLNLQHTWINDVLSSAGEQFTISLIFGEFAYWDGDESVDLGFVQPSVGIVTVNEAVPEPGTMTLLAIAGIGFAGHRLRRRWQG